MDGQNASGDRSTMSKVMDFALPAASFAASTYGPNYTAAVRTGLGALERGDDIRRRHRLGKDVMRLADSMGEKDFGDRKARHDEGKKNTQEEASAEETAMQLMGTMPGGMPGMGAAASVAKDVGKMKKTDRDGKNSERLEEFLESMPEPVRDDVYTQIGAMAMSDPDKALDMLMDRDNFSQTLRLKEMDHYRQMVRDAADKEFQAEQSDQNRAIQTRLAELKEAGANTRATEGNTAAMERTIASNQGALERTKEGNKGAIAVAEERSKGYMERAKAKMGADQAAKVDDLTSKMATITSKYPGVFQTKGDLDSIMREITEGPDRVAFQKLYREFQGTMGDDFVVMDYSDPDNPNSILLQALGDYSRVANEDAVFAGE